MPAVVDAGRCCLWPPRASCDECATFGSDVTLQCHASAADCAKCGAGYSYCHTQLAQPLYPPPPVPHLPYALPELPQAPSPVAPSPSQPPPPQPKMNRCCIGGDCSRCQVFGTANSWCHSSASRCARCGRSPGKLLYCAGLSLPPAAPPTPRLPPPNPPAVPPARWQIGR